MTTTSQGRSYAHAGRYESLLFITAAIWGSGFVAQRLGLQSLGPFTFNALRFAIGSLALVPLALARRASFRPVLVPGLIAGSVLLVASGLQQAGMQFTTAGKGGFITGLYVVLVPIGAAFLGRRVDLKTWAGVALAVLGMFFISVDGEGLGLGRGELLVLASAFFWAAHILVLDRFSPRVDPIALAIVQFAVCAVLSVPVAALTESLGPGDIAASLWPVLYSGLLTIGVGFTLQAVAQVKAHPARASIIMSLEAAFAVLSGWLILGELMDARQLAGCAIMLAGMILAQLPGRSPASGSGGTP